MQAERPAEVLRGIGRRVAELRVERGLTQARLAETLGVSLQYLQRIESGRENLTVQSLVRLGEALDVNAVDLFAAPTTRAVGRGRPPRRPPNPAPTVKPGDQRAVAEASPPETPSATPVADTPAPNEPPPTTGSVTSRVVPMPVRPPTGSWWPRIQDLVIDLLTVNPTGLTAAEMITQAASVPPEAIGRRGRPRPVERHHIHAAIVGLIRDRKISREGCPGMFIYRRTTRSGE